MFFLIPRCCTFDVQYLLPPYKYDGYQICSDPEIQSITIESTMEMYTCIFVDIPVPAIFIPKWPFNRLTLIYHRAIQRSSSSRIERTLQAYNGMGDSLDVPEMSSFFMC